ncbi:MAG TPA: L-threonine 3-dehydrogenase [Aestuariivirgaceae bacterium]|nr:L-threonine 3-dehydrogenase [Aestuariivirgaceae bacterium]
MRALVKAQAGPGLVLRDEPVPDIGPDDVLIRIRKTAICGTDVHIWNWDEWASRTITVPMIIGHEWCGEIARIGARVGGRLDIGQRVSGEGHLVGMRSRMSRAGRFHLDPETKGVGVHVPGAFAEYLKLPAFNAVSLPDDIDDDLGAILDPLGNAVHTALSFDLVGEDVLITGAGPIGIMAAVIARHIGARHVVITDVNRYRLDLAAKAADVRAVDVTREDLGSVTQKLRMAEGFDVGFEMSGVPAAFEQMVEHMVMGGRIAMLGIPAGRTDVDWSKIIFKALTIKGIYGREMFETWYKTIAMLQSGLNIAPVITHRLPADRFEDGFALMRSGQCGKVVLDWRTAPA